MTHIKCVIWQVTRHAAPNGDQNQTDLFVLRCNMLMDMKGSRRRHASGVCK